MSAVQHPRPEQERQVAALAEGFGALLRSAQKYAVLEKELRSRLSFARDEYIKLLNRIGDRSAHEYHICEKIHPDNISATTVPVPLDVTKWISPAEEAGIITQMEVKAVSKAIQTWKRVGGASAAKANRFAPAGLEKDFTTAGGVRGKLQCPFAAAVASKVGSAVANANGNGTGTGIANAPTIDASADGRSPGAANTPCGQPVAVAPSHDSPQLQSKRNADGASSSIGGATSVKGSSSIVTNRCPIRHLEDQSPEEVAQYFEAHKHDLPRSHAICIERIQKNAHCIRQIDQKYGDMVTMIQGLGQYHKRYLDGSASAVGNEDHKETAAVPPQHAARLSTEGVDRICSWADDVKEQSGSTLVHDPEHEVKPGHRRSSTPQDDKEHLVEDTEREGHFVRPVLREVRLGESPSRPWGVHVPLSHRLASPQAEAPVAVSRGVDDGLAGTEPARPHSQPDTAAKCPFDRMGATDPYANVISSTGKDGAQPAGKHRNQGQHRTIKATAHGKDEQQGESPLPQYTTPRRPPARSSDGFDQRHSASSSDRPVVFNGPVFIGYSADEVARLLHHLPASSEFPN
ncbi:hypothetical protein KEM52_002891 [Ascosphaera acerosa]|nr:hypothetical protein KEM52_002891 [Ascosphaera acerosa]